MSEREKLRLELLRLEREQVSLLRRRAKDEPLRAMVAAERELELDEEISELEGKGEAA